ncbi:MAG: OsmC family peroxiredoxin [Pseudomonadota bacterium]
MHRTAQAIWRNSLREGQGQLTTESRGLQDARFSFPTRFGSEPGTNPEELIAAAHAACFSMAFAFFAEAAGHVPQRIETTAELHFDLGAAGPSVTGVQLRLVAAVPGLEAEAFQAVSLRAKEGCLVSRLLNTAVSLEAMQA